MKTRKYTTWQVTLHWLSAALLLFSLAMGIAVLHRLDGSPRINALRIHIIVGGLIGMVMLARVAMRIWTIQPPTLNAGRSISYISRFVHITLYVAALGMVGSGLALAAQAHVFESLFGGNGVAPPRDFDAFAPHAVHAILANVLITLIVTHVAGAILHQVAGTDRVFRRMWFGQKD